MNKIKLDQDKNYTLIKVHEDGYHEVKIKCGMIMNDGGIVEVDGVVKVMEGYRISISGDWCRTSPVTGIEKTGKGIMFETWNSTYLLEEVTDEPESAA